MRKSIALSVATAFLLLAGTSFISSSAQDATTDQTPTFYRPVPGTYVNGWPRFTVTYPKDWVERRPFVDRGGVFRATRTGSANFPALGINVFTHPAPLDKLSDLFMRTYKAMSMNPILISGKTIHLPDGSEAEEFEDTAVVGGTTRWEFTLAMKKGEWWIAISVASADGRVGEDLKAIPYSIKFEPDKDKPAELPPDVQEFIDAHRDDILSHDMAKVAGRYSDRYLNSGTRKGEVERYFRQVIGGVTSHDLCITEFVPAGDRAYLTGFAIVNGTMKVRLSETSIIKENGQWKWYGNQREVAP